MDFPIPLLLILFLTYIMITYIVYLWKYNNNSHAMLSRDGESFEEFKNRVKTIYPYMEGWHHRYSEFKEIY